MSAPRPRCRHFRLLALVRPAADAVYLARHLLDLQSPHLRSHTHSHHRLALRIFGDRESAGLAVLLTLASPVFFADGISFYSMPAHLLANTLYALLLVLPVAATATPEPLGPLERLEPLGEPSAGRAFLAGVIGSIALTLHNPVPHTLFAAAVDYLATTSTARVAHRALFICRLLTLVSLVGIGLGAGYVPGRRPASPPSLPLSPYPTPPSC